MQAHSNSSNQQTWVVGELEMLVHLPKGERRVRHTNTITHSAVANMPAHKLPPTTLQNRGELCWSAAQRQYVSQAEAVQLPNSLTDPLSFTLTSALCSHPLTSHHPAAPLQVQKHHHHLPSCRKFLMISIISVHASISCQE